MKTLKSCSPSPATASPARSALRIEVLGCGPIISYKNSKLLLPAKGRRRARLITKPEYQKLIARYEERIELALLSAYRTAVAGMQTVPSLRSWIVSSVFRDDSLTDIPESDGYRVEFVEPGAEGIVVEITRLGSGSG